MAIWVDNETRLVVQGITGQEGTFHALGCRDYGTRVVAGVTPGKGGQSVEGIPVFDSVAEARAETGCNASMIFVPPPFAADAIMEALLEAIETGQSKPAKWIQDPGFALTQENMTEREMDMWGCRILKEAEADTSK